MFSIFVVESFCGTIFEFPTVAIFVWVPRGGFHAGLPSAYPMHGGSNAASAA